jgi:RHS repeat-associated protein
VLTKLTDISGYVDQHTMCRSIFYGVLQANLCSTNTNKIQIGIQYLPFGELFISQRNSTFDSRYKFTAKELDNETQYTYFGARYYDSDISIWLSVDPLAQERPWLSPYNYCQLNPIGRIDPTGALDELYITGEDEAAVQESFNQLQSTTNLKLELNIETGQVTASGEAITKEDTRLMEVISDEKIKVNIEVQNPMFGEGAFLGTYYDVSTEQAETFNQYNPYNMKELETKHKAINGSGILHEITEGFEAGKITLQLKRGLQSAWRRIDVRTGEETYSPDYEHYETAHERATPPPNEKRKKIK